MPNMNIKTYTAEEINKILGKQMVKEVRRGVGSSVLFTIIACDEIDGDDLRTALEKSSLAPELDFIKVWKSSHTVHFITVKQRKEEIFRLAKSGDPGDLSKVKELLLSNLDPHFKNETGKDLLFAVIKEWCYFNSGEGGALAFIDFLVDKIGIDINTTRDEDGNSLLSTAIDKVKLTTSIRSKEEWKHIKYDMKHTQYKNLERITVKEYDDERLIVMSEKNAGIIAHLLSKGAKPNITKPPPHSAIKEAMASLNIEDPSSSEVIATALSLKAESTNTPICFTVEKGLLCTTRLLLEAGANINATDASGDTLLRLVALKYDRIPDMYRDVTELLIEHGIDLNQKGNESEYPIITILDAIKAKHPNELNSMLEKLGKQKHTMNSELKSKIESKFGSLDIGASRDGALSGKNEACVIVTEKGVMNDPRGGASLVGVRIRGNPSNREVKRAQEFACSVVSNMRNITVDTVVDKSKGTVKKA